MTVEQRPGAGLLTRPCHPFTSPAGSGEPNDGATHHELIRSNVAACAQALLAEGPRLDRIAPAPDDPRYENLYDRAFALLGDGAALEHLAIARGVDRALVSDHDAGQWITSIVRAWSAEVETPIDYGSAYALTRLHKGVAVGLEAFAPVLTEHDTREVVDFLIELGGSLWRDWFSQPPARGPVGLSEDRHSPHHASVEWSAFGIASLVLRPHEPEAATWLDAAIEQFVDVLLPDALGIDGAPPEGFTLLGVDSFWASTMFSRIQFIEALVRLTGRDLADEVPGSINADFGRALCRQIPHLPRAEGEDRLAVRRWPLLPRAAGGVLCWLAARHGDAELHGLAAYDRRSGVLESSFVSTPTRGLRLRNAHNSYAAVWHQPAPTVPRPDRNRVFCFPTLGLAVSPTGFDTGRFAVAIDQGRVVIWLGESLVYQDLVPERICDLEASEGSGTPIYVLEPRDQEVIEVGGYRLGSRHFLSGRNAEGETVVRVEVDAAEPSVRVTRTVAPGHRWRSEFDIEAADGADVVDLLDDRGRIQLTVPEGVEALRGQPTVVQESVGYGLLELHDESDYSGLRDHQLHVDATRPVTLVFRPVPIPVAGGPETPSASASTT